MRSGVYTHLIEARRQLARARLGRRRDCARTDIEVAARAILCERARIDVGHWKGAASRAERLLQSGVQRRGGRVAVAPAIQPLQEQRRNLPSIRRGGGAAWAVRVTSENRVGLVLRAEAAT